MTSPFSNGSSIAELQRPARYAEPVATQPADAYAKQVYNNQSREESDLRRDMERQALLERGRQLAGYIQRDRRAQGLGFEWTQIRAPLWPEQMPEGIQHQVKQAIDAQRAAQNALGGALQAFQFWAQERPAASDELRRLEYERLTLDPATAAEKAEQRLDQVLTEAAAIVAQIERWQEAEQAAPGRRAAAEKAYQQALATIDTDLLTVRAQAQRFGVQV